MSLRYEDLRAKYPEFIYKDFTVERLAMEGGEEALQVTYHFVVPGLAEFRPTLRFPIGQWDLVNDPTSELGRKILFSIGMVELVSYWKMACPPLVTVEGGALSEAQIAWWKDLYFNGLGEFFYTNEINPDPQSFMTIRPKPPASAPLPTTASAAGNEVFRRSGRQIVPIGGGKDSIVTIEHLASQREKNLLFSINPTQAALDTMTVAGYGEEQRLLVSRTLDPEMLRLNREGFLNGHTPFSALLAFVSFYCAYVTGSEAIILSNEASANAATVPGTSINHQYSKTSQFEIAFQTYTKTYLLEEIYYFSLLRPFAELAIAKSFTKYPQYFAHFRSCNVGSKKNIWCGHCSKCLFVYAVLAPFLEEKELIKIFGSNLWETRDLEEDWLKLLGAVPVKPFECVGTVEEVQYATYLTINKYSAAGDLPYLLQAALAEAKAGNLSQVYWDGEELVSLSPKDPLAVWQRDERVPVAYKALVADLVTEGRVYAE